MGIFGNKKDGVAINPALKALIAKKEVTLKQTVDIHEADLEQQRIHKEHSDRVLARIYDKWLSNQTPEYIKATSEEDLKAAWRKHENELAREKVRNSRAHWDKRKQARKFKREGKGAK